MDEEKNFLDNPFDIKFKVEIAQWKILIIDSSDEFCNKVIKSIKDFKFEDKNIEVIHTNTYQSSISTIISNPDITLAFIDTDVENEKDGLKIVSYIRNTLKDNNIKLIVLADNLDNEYNVILNYNVNDYRIKKKLTDKRIFAAIISKLRSYHDTLKTIQLKNKLEELVDSRTIELIEANSRIKKNLSEMKNDQKSGEAIQEKMLPANNMFFNNFYFEYFWKPALYLSGDIFDYYQIDDNHIGFYLADVSGHGISSAFITIFIKNIIHQYIGQYNTNGDWSILDPPKILFEINNELLDANLDKHLTMFYGIININDNKLIYSTGGHYPYPLLCSEKEKKYINDRGFSLGNFDIATYKRLEIDLPKSFTLLLMTDGILDIIPNTDNSEKEQLFINLYKNGDINIKNILNKVGYSEEKKLSDDLTILKIKKY